MKKNKKLSEEVDLRQLLFKVANNWFLFAVILAASILIAYAVNTYKTPSYTLYTKILIKTDENNAAIDPSVFLEGFGLLGESKNFQNEIQVLKSSYLVRDALRTLNLEVSYFAHEKLGKREMYKSSPIVVVFDKQHHQALDVDFVLDFHADGTFTIEADEDEVNIYSYDDNEILYMRNTFFLSETYAIGDNIETTDIGFKILISNDYSLGDLEKKKFSFRFNDINKLTKSFKSSIRILPTNEEGTVANIMLEASNKNMGIDFLNALSSQYLLKTLDKNNYIALSTIDYIDNQLQQISDSLDLAERKLQDFRVRNQIIDISSKAETIFERQQSLLREQQEIEVQINYFEYIKEYLEENQSISDIVAPSSMGIEDPLLNTLILELSTLNSEKNSLIDNNQEKSPYLGTLNVKINNLKTTILENVNYVLNTSRVALTDIEERIARINLEIGQLPKKERELVGIQRDFQLTDGIYTFLLEKRAEAEIAKASNLPDCEVIEPATLLGNGPNTPRTKINYLAALFLGLFIPLLIIYLKDNLSDKFKDKSDIVKWTDYSVIGTILHNSFKTPNVLVDQSNSPISESIRALRANYRFYGRKGKNQMALVTSTHEKEGKSFISYNLATSFALESKKTALINLDLRKPAIEKYIGIRREIGITSYLIDDALLSDITCTTDIENLDFFPMGKVPPNPTELLGSDNVKKLLNDLRDNYSNIIIDMPPVGLVSDAFLLMEHVDLCLFVTRQRHTSKRFLREVLEELEEKNSITTGIIINDILAQRGSYSYRYAYTDSKENSIMSHIKKIRKSSIKRSKVKS